MKKLIMFGFVCSLTALFMISSAFAEPYKDKAFPEQQVIKAFCGDTNKNCSYIGQVEGKGSASYDAYFMEQGRVGFETTVTVWRLDSGIWLMRQGASAFTIIMK